MNKRKLVEAVASRTKNPKTLVEEVLHGLLEVIQEEIAKGEDVTLMGFGTFLPGVRKASQGYNPHTGSRIDVPEMRLPKFRPGKAFKERLNK
jgi:DNA-binding protein HU-beta